MRAVWRGWFYYRFLFQRTAQISTTRRDASAGASEKAVGANSTETCISTKHHGDMKIRKDALQLSTPHA